MSTVIHNYGSPTARNDSVKSSRRSDESYASQSTAPTSLCESPRPSPRPSLQQHASPRSKLTPYDPDFSMAGDPCRSSRETYDSTLMSAGDLYEEPEEYDYALPDFTLAAEDEVESRPSTSQDFSQFFPTQKRLCIRHDDTTSDGNMNLRVEVEHTEEHRKVRVQLFHLRMQDLKERRFSLRRYCRDSGREVCHTARRYAKPASERPGIQRSMSHAFATLRSKPEIMRRNSGGSVTHRPTRQDSGYGSTGEDDLDGEVAAFMGGAGKGTTKAAAPMPTNTTKLEFSNYAQVDVRRRGSRNNKRYEFEYWGSSYRWKRVVDKKSSEKIMSYHLLDDEGGGAIAHIVPEVRSHSQKVAEEAAGGWVPPCSMWISSHAVPSVSTDVADVIVATGLMALVDDCIKLHFQPKPKAARHISVPLTPLNLEYVGPKAFVEHVFRRRNSADRDKDAWSPGLSPLRQTVD